MADATAIEWTDATWNPVTGCSIVSPGCTHCYAMKLAGTRLKHTPSRVGLTRDSKAGPVWTGEVRFNEQWLDQPLRWKRARKIFVCAHGDLFAENVPDEWIDRVFAVMALAPQHTFQVLTKRAARMRAYVSSLGDGSAPDRVTREAFLIGQMVRGYRGNGGMAARPLPNVWLGVSAERQQEWDERTVDLKATPAAIRFVSAEPLLGPIEADLSGLDWIIAGGESGPCERPMHPAWARSIRDQCAAAGTAFFFKQWGSFRALTPAEHGQACGATLIPGSDPHHREAFVLPAPKKIAGRLLDGVEHSAFPQVPA